MGLRFILAASLCVLWPITSWAAETSSGPGQPAPATDVQGGGNLSDKLSTTNGVIHPEQNLDPTISKAPLAGGSTPVIPPPGSPGGDQSVKPK